MKLRSLKAITATVTALCLCCTLVGCGGSESSPEQQLEDKLSSMSDKDAEKAIEKAAESIEATEGKSAETTAAPQEITYEPCEEIKNADFSSGLVQIGNDVFHNGGYYTVDQFIQEFGDRYDMSAISPNGFMKVREEKSFSIVSLKDANLKISVQYNSRNVETDDDKVRIGDSVVTYVAIHNTDYCWYPKGITLSAEDYEYSAIPSFLEQNGFVSVTRDQAKNENRLNYGMYWEDTNSFDDVNRYIVFLERGTEQNAAGFYPIFEYKFSYKLDTGEVNGFACNTHAIGMQMNGDLDQYTRIG